VTVQLAHYLGLLHGAEDALAKAFAAVADAHADEPDVTATCLILGAQCRAHADSLHPFARHYGEQEEEEPERLHSDLLQEPRTGKLGLLRDLHGLYLMASECDICWTLVGQAAQGARDSDLHRVVQTCEGETSDQLRWLRSRMKQAAPQVLVVV
jgi:hypothetical protein